MATVERAPEQRTVLRHIGWDTYERILRDHADSSAPRLTYDRGTLEIMIPLPVHEQYTHFIELLVIVVAEQAAIDLCGRRSTTFTREDLARGFEPDTCFYIQHEALVRGKPRLDLRVDPPPDLVVEIDITHSTLDKLALYAAFEVPEVWRYDGERPAILARAGDGYAERERSLALPLVTAAALTALLTDSIGLGDLAWLRRVRAWAGTLPARPQSHGPGAH